MIKVEMFSEVPLQLIVKDINKSKKENFCDNPCPCSMKICRSIKFDFVKETDTKVIEEVDNVMNEIKNIIPSSL